MSPLPRMHWISPYSDPLTVQGPGPGTPPHRDPPVRSPSLSLPLPDMDMFKPVQLGAPHPQNMFKLIHDEVHTVDILLECFHVLFNINVRQI